MGSQTAQLSIDQQRRLHLGVGRRRAPRLEQTMNNVLNILDRNSRQDIQSDRIYYCEADRRVL